jgi:hypothetical protein
MAGDRVGNVTLGGRLPLAEEWMRIESTLYSFPVRRLPPGLMIDLSTTQLDLYDVDDPMIEVVVDCGVTSVPPFVMTWPRTKVT